ncbi:MAG: hypothetical protein ABFC42_09275 [Sulfuricella sp.]
MKPVVKVDKLAQVVRGISSLMKKDVLVGVPDSTTGRTDGEGMNNATLAYIHDNGSPAANIPARPFMRPGIKNAEKPIASQMKKAATATLDGKQKEADKALNKAGMVASSSIKEAITDGEGFEALAPGTIASRNRSRGTASRRDSEKSYLEMLSNGMSPADAQEAAGIKPLINTGSMRNSITYVVRKK